MANAWDLGLDYERIYKRLVKELKEIRGRRGKRALARRTYLVVLLTQLRNGSRVGEAINAVIEFYKQKKNIVEVRVEKKKREEYRKMVLPKEITREDLEIAGPRLLALVDKYNSREDLSDKEKNNRITATISNWAKKYLKINTHSLRYAFITYLIKKGYPASLIAKMTHHSKLDMILNYTQQKTADKILEDLDSL